MFTYEEVIQLQSEGDPSLPLYQPGTLAFEVHVLR